jgi:2-isopropylmalate synthase
VRAVVEAGADVINLPDTVGYTTPQEIRGMFEHVIKNVPGSDKVVFSTHNHNDLGLAVANALAAVQGGARQIECTINGIGERAGNTSLEEVVMAMQAPATSLSPSTGDRDSPCRWCRQFAPWQDHWPRHSLQQARSSAETPSPTNPASTSTA